MRPDAVAAQAAEGGGGEGPSPTGSAAADGEQQPAGAGSTGRQQGASLAFHLITTARELARPDCDGRYLCDWWTAARGGRAVIYDYDTPAGRAAARALFAREDGGPAAVARHFALHGPAQSAKRRRQSERAAAGPPVPGTLGGALEVDRCRKALAEWLAAPATEPPEAARRAAKAREAKRRHLAVSAALLRRTVGDAVAFAKAAAAAGTGSSADEPERALEAGLEGGKLKLVLFPAPHFSVEVAVRPALPPTAADLGFLRRARGLRGVEIVLIDETWPQARRIFEDLAGGDGEDEGDELLEDGEVERILRGLFEADDEWAALEAAGQETLAAAFLRRAFVITLAPEDPEAREGYGLVSNFPRGQEDAQRGVGVCSLEAGLRLGELVGLLSAADRRAGQKAGNEWLGEQLANT